MSLVESFVRNPVKVAVGVLLLALFGLIALGRLPIQLTPEVQTPTITVETSWPGASPGEIEREIVQEQEEQLKSVEGLVKLSSECLDSMGRVTMEFTVGTDMQSALLKVNSRLQQVREYPEDADEPVLATSSSADTPIGWFILRPQPPTAEAIESFMAEHPEFADELAAIQRSQNTGLRLARLRRFVAEHPQAAALVKNDVDVTALRRFAEDNIEAAFERVPGVSNANVLGGREDELQVIVDPSRLATRRLTIDDLRQALVGRNTDTSGGEFWESKRRWVVRTIGRFSSVDEVSNSVVARRDGRPVYVKDVADVRLGHKKPDGWVKNFGTTSIAINCVREGDANVLEVMEGLRAQVQALNAGILADSGLNLEQVYDETEYIDSAIGLVNQNILVGGLLTIAVLLLFLRSGRSTLVLALAIPTSLVGTFLVLDLLGRSLNVISLAGLAFAVGMLVDNAVVVLENVYRRHQSGEDRTTAAVRGTNEVWGAVTASTLTTLAVFLPVLFIEEEAGQLFRDIAIAISAAVGLSMLVSVIVIPTATARILPRRRDIEVRAGRTSLLSVVDRPAAAFVSAVVATNQWIFRARRRQLAAVCVLTGTALLGAWLLAPKVEYLPTGNRNLVFGILIPPPGLNLDKLEEMGSVIEEGLRPYWDLDVSAEEAARIDKPAIKDFFYVARGRQIFVGVRSIDPLRSADLIPILQGVAGQLPGTFVIAKQSSIFERGLSAGRSIDIEISGDEIETLIALGGQAMGMIPSLVPGSMARPIPSLDLANPEVHVVPDWDRAADIGLSAREIGYAVNAFVDGAYAADYYIGGDKIDLTIMGRDGDVARTQDLATLPVSTRSGEIVPLGAMATVEIAAGPEQINHRERARAITIQVTPPAEMAIEDAMDRIERDLVAPLREAAEGRARINLSGTADKLRSTWQALRFNVILALLITYLLMAALFESWVHPLVIIFSVPLGAVGGIAALALLNRFVLQPLDVLTMLGFVILIGTVVNNAILIVHQALNHQREEGLAADRAVLESVRTRIRPIFMTTVTTVAGLVPLVVSPGAGSELYRGLGAVVLGGLVVSTLFTLVLVPTLFVLMQSFRASLAQLIGRSPAIARSESKDGTVDVSL